MPWEFIIPGSITAALLLVFGAMYFRSMERVFVDVI
jgi:lipopolysaccharide transport system permease protein